MYCKDQILSSFNGRSDDEAVGEQNIDGDEVVSQNSLPSSNIMKYALFYCFVIVIKISGQFYTIGPL